MMSASLSSTYTAHCLLKGLRPVHLCAQGSSYGNDNLILSKTNFGLSSSFLQRQSGNADVKGGRKFMHKLGGGSALMSTAIIDWAAIPAWLVKSLAERVYDPNPCSEGRYLDPNTKACVYICRPGYSYDPELKACVASIEQCLSGYTLKGDRCEMDIDCGEGFVYDADSDMCIPVQSLVGEPRRTWSQLLLSWLTQGLFRSGSSCPVGFYYDPQSKACVPLCAKGYQYDPAVKKCVPVAALRGSWRP